MSEVKTDKISSVSTNGDITLDPDGTGDVVVASGHRLGVGTTSPADHLAVVTSGANAQLSVDRSDGATGRTVLIHSSSGGQLQTTGSAPLIFGTADTERMRITGDGQGGVAIGGTDPDPTSDGTATRAFLAVQGSGNRGCLALGTTSNSGGDVAALRFNNGSNVVASIGVDSDSGSTSTGKMQFFTGGTQRAVIDSNGDVIIGKTTSSFSTPGFFFNESPGQLDITCNQNNPLRLNRVNNDGIMTSFQQDSSEEGTISVSGGTVSYNGGHLSRWSRLLDGSKPSTILKGTVMSNLDDMIMWSHDAIDAVLDDDGNEIEPARDAYTEDNEQLNHTKISDAEGDADVAGVFVAWDDRDSFNDFFLAMTGDMVIRIASGTTVARGDLLMSAGDGTAKPQDDDIVRSKTIAKVTSTNVSHTYDDGSYLVPCVLMAC